jgi:GH18 family chitinase
MVLVLALSVASAYAQNAHENHLPKRIVADHGYWSKSQDPPYGHAEIPYHKLTHINHAGVSFNADGSLSVPDGFLEPELNRRAHHAGVKVMLLLGGDFNGLEATGAIKTLVANIAAFAQQYGYDGVDIDWEYPSSTQDRTFLVKLMKSLRQSDPDYTLSVDVAPWGGYGYDLKHLQLSPRLFQYHDV